MSTDEEKAAEEAAVAAAEATGEDEGETKKLRLDVVVENLGLCRKKVKVTIPHEDITAQFDTELGEMVATAAVPGFRPGRAPRKLLERRFRDEVRDQVKGKLLMRSLEQVGEDYKIEAIAEPKLDAASIEVPEEGSLTYEFEVETAPEFELPEYKGIKIKRPVREFGEADVAKQLQRFLQGYGKLAPVEKPVEKGDYVVLDVSFFDGDKLVSKSEELTIAVQPTLRFRDGTIEKFDEALKGAAPNETRTADVQISDEAPNAELRGKRIRGEFLVKDVKQLRLPELNPEFLTQIGYETEQQLRDALYSILQRRLEHEQRRSARQQLMEQLTQLVGVELPQDLVRRQVSQTLRRRVLELRQAGYSDHEIRAAEVELRQNAIRETQRALREHFILAKIAEKEELEVTPQDVDDYIQAMALQQNESPRRVRARLKKEGSLDQLEIQILEQLAMDRALEYAQYENVPLVEEEKAVEAVDQAATPSDEPAEPAAEGASVQAPETHA